MGMMLAQQDVSDAPFFIRIDRIEQGDLDIRTKSYGYTVAIQQAMILLQDRTSFRCDYPSEIQWISGADCDEIALSRFVAHLA